MGKSPGNEVTSAPGERFSFKPVSEECLIPGALYSDLGCRAFEIAASLVGYVVEENSFFSKGFKSERCRELLFTI